MPGILSAAAHYKTAQKHLRTVTELEERWEKLSDEEKDEVRTEWVAVKAAAKQVRRRISYGPRGFVNEFKAAKDGREPDAIDEGKPLPEGVKELYKTIRAMKAALDRLSPPAADDAPAPD